MAKRTDFRADIAAVVQALNLAPSDFRLLGLHEYESILLSIIDQFTTLDHQGVNQRWLWDAFKNPSCSMPLDDATTVLKELVPIGETVWFIAEDARRNKRYGNYWVYEGKIGPIVDVIRETYYFEYYVVSKKFEWLLCENHHDILMAVGHPMVDKLAQIPFVKQ
jgi:hypothetical protein